MKITLDIPDTMMCAFFSYVHHEGNKIFMKVRSLDSNALKDGALIKVQPEGEDGNETD